MNRPGTSKGSGATYSRLRERLREKKNCRCSLVTLQFGWWLIINFRVKGITDILSSPFPEGLDWPLFLFPAPTPSNSAILPMSCLGKHGWIWFRMYSACKLQTKWLQIESFTDIQIYRIPCLQYMFLRCAIYPGDIRRASAQWPMLESQCRRSRVRAHGSNQGGGGAVWWLQGGAPPSYELVFEPH